MPWIVQLTKALVLRSHPQGKSAAIKVSRETVRLVYHTRAVELEYCLYLQLFDLFGDARLSSHAADCFSVLLTDTEEVLNTKCHAVVRVREPLCYICN